MSHRRIYSHLSDCEYDSMMDDARRDAAEAEWDAKVEEFLAPMVEAAFEAHIETMTDDELDSLDEDALREELREELWDDAEAEAQENQPCCNDWYCPCGNRASRPG